MIWVIVIGIILFILYRIRSGLNVQISDLEDISSGGDFDQPIVGESKYQSQLNAIVGERNPKGVRIKKTAVISLDDDNQYDKKAVCVDIENKTVGYLSREDARLFRKHIKSQGIKGFEWRVDALIIGGKLRNNEWLSYGVVLDLSIEED
jgi:hypothetical protein